MLEIDYVLWKCNVVHWIIFDVLFCIKVAIYVSCVKKGTFNIVIKDFLSISYYREIEAYATAFSTFYLHTGNVWTKHLIWVYNLCNHFLFDLVTDICPAINQFNTIYSINVCFLAIFSRLVPKIGPEVRAVERYLLIIIFTYAIIRDCESWQESCKRDIVSFRTFPIEITHRYWFVIIRFEDPGKKLDADKNCEEEKRYDGCASACHCTEVWLASVVKTHSLA